MIKFVQSIWNIGAISNYLTTQEVDDNKHVL